MNLSHESSLPQGWLPAIAQAAMATWRHHEVRLSAALISRHHGRLRRAHEKIRTRNYAAIFSLICLQCLSHAIVCCCPQFAVWNAHDVAGIQALHAPASSLKDWDASHGPTNEAVAAGIGGIWKAVPEIKIEIVDVYTMGPSMTCVANIKVIVDASTTLKVCDVIEYDSAGLVVSLNAYKAD